MKNKRGFSLIELVIAIVIISTCAIGVAIMFQEASSGSYIAVVMTVATALAEEKMEETLRLGYSSASSVSSTAFASPFDDYTYEVIVHYVDESDLDTSVDPTVTDYKNVEVQISHAVIDQAVVLNSVLANY